MATYRYSVIIEMGIDTDGLSKGKPEVQSELRQIEQMQIDSQRRIDREIGQSVSRRNSMMTKAHSDTIGGIVRQEEKATASIIDGYIKREKAHTESIGRELKAEAKTTQQYYTDRIKKARELGVEEEKLRKARLAEVDAINRDTQAQRARQGRVSGFAQVEIDSGLSNIDKILGQQKIADVDRQVRQLDASARKGAQGLGMWGTAFKGAFIGAVAGITFSLITSGIFSIGRAMAAGTVESVKYAANLEETTNALAVFTGSVGSAKRELVDIGKIARDTTGLRLEAAEQGFQHLRALGFQAKLSQGFIKELGEEKILSGASDEALGKIIFNFAQIASGGQKVSQELREIVTQMPTLQRAFFDAFGTLDPQRIQKFFDEDKEAAFQRLVDAMAKGKQATGGLNDAVGKLTDEFIVAAREFGTPFLDPVTRDVKDLSVYLRENADTWREWGVAVSDAYRGASQLLYLLGAPGGADQSSQTGIGEFATRYGIFGAAGQIYKNFQAAGEIERRRVSDQLADRTRAGVGAADLDRTNYSAFLRPDGTLNFQTPEEIKVRELEKERVSAQIQDKARQLRVAAIELEQKDALARNESFYKIQQARLQAHLDYTVEQEKETAGKVSISRQSEIQAQIALVQKFHNDRVKFGNLSADEQLKLEAETGLEVLKLQTEFSVERQNQQKRDLEFEHRIQEQRRQAQIEFLNLQTTGIRQSLNRQTFDIERQLTEQSGSYEVQFAQLRTITQKAYDDIVGFTRQSYELQLQDKSLTDEQILNLQKKRDLELQDLAEQHRQKMIGIEDRQYRESITRLQDYSRRQTSILRALADNASTIGNLFNPTSFSQDSLKVFQSQFLGRGLTERANQTLDAFEAAGRKSTSDMPLAEYRKQYNEAEKAFKAANTADLEFKASLRELDPQIKSTYEEIETLGIQLTKTAGSYRNFDAISQKSLFLKQQNEIQAFNKDIELNQKLLAGAEDRYKRGLQAELQEADRKFKEFQDPEKRRIYGDTAPLVDQIYADQITDLKGKIAAASQPGFETTNREILELRNTIILLALGLKDLNGAHAQQEAERYANSIDGLTDKLNKLATGDIAEQNRLREIAEKSYLRQQISDYEQIYQLKHQLANSPYINSLAIEKAYLEDVAELRGRETEAIIRQNRARLELADKFVYSKTRADADFSEYLASQKGLTDILSEARINLVTDAFNGLDSVIGRLTKNFGSASQSVAKLIGDLIRLFALPYLQKLMGGGTGGQQGGIQIPGLGNIGGIGGTAPFNPNAAGGGGFQPFQSTGFSNPLSFLTGGGGGGFNQPVNADATPAIGSYLGNGRYQGVGIGQTAPQGGGFLSSLFSGQGIGAAISTMGISIGIQALTASLQTHSPLKGALMGGLVGFVAGILNRNRRRKREEKLRDTAIRDAFSSIDKLIEQVKMDKIDGDAAISQAEQIRENYVEQMNQLKDKKTRSHALADVSRIDAKIGELKAAVAGQISRRERLELLAPTFGEGGSLSHFARRNYRDNPLGYRNEPESIGYFPKSDIHARYNERGSEYIFDHETTANVGTYHLDNMRATKGASFKALLRNAESNLPNKATGGGFNQTTSFVPAPAPSAPSIVGVEVQVGGVILAEDLANALVLILKKSDGTTELKNLSNAVKTDGQEFVTVLMNLMREKGAKI